MSKFFSAGDIKKCVTSEERDFAREALAKGLKFRYEPKIPNCAKRCDFVFCKPISIFFVKGNEKIYAVEIKRGSRRCRRDKEQHVALRKYAGLHTLIFTKKDVDLLLLGGFDGNKLPRNFKYKKKVFSKDSCSLCRSIYTQEPRAILRCVHTKRTYSISSLKLRKREDKIRRRYLKKRRKINKRRKKKK